MEVHTRFRPDSEEQPGPSPGNGGHVRLTAGVAAVSRLSLSHHPALACQSGAGRRFKL
jgi:hypothetical protein